MHGSLDPAGVLRHLAEARAPRLSGLVGRELILLRRLDSCVAARPR